MLVHRLSKTLRDQIESGHLTHIYETMDLPLVSVLLRMEQAGVFGLIPACLALCLPGLRWIWITLLSEFMRSLGTDFNINSPKQLGDVLFNKMLLPKPMKYGKGKVVSTAQDVLEELAEHHAVPALCVGVSSTVQVEIDLSRLAATTDGRPGPRAHYV